MALVEGKEYPEHLYYDLDNQIWYEPLDDGTVRAGFTPLAIEPLARSSSSRPSAWAATSRRNAPLPPSSAESGWALLAPPSPALWWRPTPSSSADRSS